MSRFISKTVMIARIAIYIYAYMVIVDGTDQWLLVWNEEFSSNQTDSNKWDVEDAKRSCHGTYNQQLQCHTASDKNVRLTGDVLAITAIKETYLDKEYTSAQLTTKFSFTYGKVEIRAALPNGYMLRPAIWMIPANASNEWPKSGQIDVFTNIQSPQIASGAHYFNGISPYYWGNNNAEYVVDSDVTLNDYHVYTLEWTRHSIKWFFDGFMYYSVDTNQKFGSFYARNGQPFDHNYKLTFHLGIGGLFFSTLLTEQHVIDWNCSLLIIDYIRIYQLDDTNRITNANTSHTRPLVNTNTSVNSICWQIMSQLRPVKVEVNKTDTNSLRPVKNETNEAGVSFVWIVLIILAIIVISLVVTVAALLLRLRAKRQKLVAINENAKQKENHYMGEYDDTNVCDNHYEEIPELYDKVKYSAYDYNDCKVDDRYANMKRLAVDEIGSSSGAQIKAETNDSEYVAMTSKSS